MTTANIEGYNKHWVLMICQSCGKQQRRYSTSKICLHKHNGKWCRGHLMIAIDGGIKLGGFLQETEAQHNENIKKWGHQDLATLVIALGEEYGEICRSFLEGRPVLHLYSNIKEEIVHAAALLKALYEDLP